MKSLIRWCTVMMIVTVVISVMPTEAEGEIYEDTLRLHILANSDSPADQELKLAVRDKILEKYGDSLRLVHSVEEAKDTVGGLLPDIEEDAEGWIRQLGYDYPVRATVSTEWYDTREYDGFTLPQGYYSSLRVIIGNGDGKNWWCVMYPPLCLEMATESAPADDGLIDYTREEISLIKSGSYQIKFKILEELSSVFSKNG